MTCQSAETPRKSGQPGYFTDDEFSSSIQRLTLTIVSSMVLSDILSPAYISLDSSIFNCRWSVDRICIQSSIKSVIVVTIHLSVPSADRSREIGATRAPLGAIAPDRLNLRSAPGAAAASFNP